MFLYKGFTIFSWFSSTESVWYNTENNKYYISRDTPTEIKEEEFDDSFLLIQRPKNKLRKILVYKDKLTKPYREITVKELEEGLNEKAVLRFHPYKEVS